MNSRRLFSLVSSQLWIKALINWDSIWCEVREMHVIKHCSYSLIVPPFLPQKRGSQEGLGLSNVYKTAWRGVAEESTELAVQLKVADWTANIGGEEPPEGRVSSVISLETRRLSMTMVSLVVHRCRRCLLLNRGQRSTGISKTCHEAQVEVSMAC